MKKRFKKEKKKKVKENPKGELFRLYVRKEGAEFLFRKIKEVKVNQELKKEAIKLIKKI